MFTFYSIVLALAVCLSGLYTGVLLLCQVGILPAMRTLLPAEYASFWRAMDPLMESRMPPLKIGMLLALSIAVSLAVQRGRTHFALLLFVALLLHLADLGINVRVNFPLNKKIRELPSSADAATILAILAKTRRSFAWRCAFTTTAFVLLCFTIVHGVSPAGR